jgi:p-hydroxybenzoate 3-monooxygenase
MAAGAKRCLRRVWRALRFSWWFTSVTHALSDDAFAQKLQLAELRNLALSSAARSSVAESYVGLPLEEP